MYIQAYIGYVPWYCRKTKCTKVPKQSFLEHTRFCNEHKIQNDFFCNNCYNDGKIIWVKLSNDNYILVFLFRIPQFIFCLKEAGCKP